MGTHSTRVVTNVYGNHLEQRERNDLSGNNCIQFLSSFKKKYGRKNTALLIRLRPKDRSIAVINQGSYFLFQIWQRLQPHADAVSGLQLTAITDAAPGEFESSRVVSEINLQTLSFYFFPFIIVIILGREISIYQ